MQARSSLQDILNCLKFLTIIKLNNKLLRILQNKPIKSHADELYLAYNTLSIPKLHDFQLLLFAYKVVHHPEKLSEILCSYFEFNNHQTRSMNDIHMFRANTNYEKKGLKL